ncbi:MAG: DNA recombination protein RmuC, partial [Candidatus Binatia bacterium]
MTEQIVYTLLGIGAGGALVWFWVRRRDDALSGHDHMIALQRLIAEQMDRISQQMDRRLQENIRAMNESKDFLAHRVSAAEKSVRSVSASLGKLSQATDALHKTNQEIISFQQLLRSPKIRGSFGEVMLGNLLAEMLPQDRYELQYGFRSTGEITDAIIRLQDGHIVAVDAKFPLANYQAFVDNQDQERKEQLRRVFLRDVKKHVSDIAKKYISAEEQTLDFAFMYIPIESVYYEAIMHDAEREGLWEFSLKHHVMPVSPNSLYAYLQTVLMGLRGMKIEQQAREILEHLG